MVTEVHKKFQNHSESFWKTSKNVNVTKKTPKEVVFSSFYELTNQNRPNFLASMEFSKNLSFG